MAIVLEATYSKKLGLPGYSSHQYSLTLRTEVAELTQVETESTRLHGLLQSSVDREIQNIGFLPGGNNGNRNAPTNPNSGNYNARSNPPPPGNGNEPGNGDPSRQEAPWNCTSKQKQFILRLVEQFGLDKNRVEELAQEQFGKSVRQLNKLEASGLIEELKAQVQQT